MTPNVREVVRAGPWRRIFYVVVTGHVFGGNHNSVAWLSRKQQSGGKAGYTGSLKKTTLSVGVSRLELRALPKHHDWIAVVVLRI